MQGWGRVHTMGIAGNFMATIDALGYFANEPERLLCALHELRSTLSAPEGASGVGVAHFMDDRLLLNLRPSAVAGGTPMEELVGAPKTSSLMASLHADGDGGPFKFRSWAFCLHGGAGRDGRRAALLSGLPDFLKRNMAGESVGEVAFHRLLATLHEKGRLDDPNIDGKTAADALRDTLEKLGPVENSRLSMLLTNGRILAGIHKGGGMAYILREGILACQRCQLDRALDPFPLRESHRRFRGVLVADGLSQTPPGFLEVPAGKVIAVSRKLDVQLY